MKVISKYAVSKEMVHNLKIPLDEFSKTIRREMMGNTVMELAERLPVFRWEEKDSIQA